MGKFEVGVEVVVEVVVGVVVGVEVEVVVGVEVEVGVGVEVEVGVVLNKMTEFELEKIIHRDRVMNRKREIALQKLDNEIPEVRSIIPKCENIKNTFEWRKLLSAFKQLKP